jgi:hypothetical protein
MFGFLQIAFVMPLLKPSDNAYRTTTDDRSICDRSLSARPRRGPTSFSPAYNIGRQYFHIRSQLDYRPLSREVCDEL